MIWNSQRLIDKVRFYMLEQAGIQQGNSLTDQQILDLMNEEQDDLVAAMVEGSEDYFGVVVDQAITAGVNVYPLFGGCLFLRKIQYMGGDQVSQVNPTDMIESRLVEGTDQVGGTATPDQTQYFYAVYGDDLNIAPTPQSDVASPAIREYAIREPGPLMVDILGSGGVVGAADFKFQSVDAPTEDDIMIGTYVNVVAGTGVGQRRKIIDYVGVTKQATVSVPFGPALDATSKVATESRIVRLFHSLLSLGAAIRAKTALEEDVNKLRALYDISYGKFEDFVYKARTGGQRAITTVDFDVI